MFMLCFFFYCCLRGNAWNVLECYCLSVCLWACTHVCLPPLLQVLSRSKKINKEKINTTSVISPTRAGLAVICCADPVVAVAPRPVELPRVSDLTYADAAVTLPPPAADQAIWSPAASLWGFGREPAPPSNLPEEDEEKRRRRRRGGGRRAECLYILHLIQAVTPNLIHLLAQLPALLVGAW